MKHKREKKELIKIDPEVVKTTLKIKNKNFF